MNIKNEETDCEDILGRVHAYKTVKLWQYSTDQNKVLGETASIPEMPPCLMFKKLW